MSKFYDLINKSDLPVLVDFYAEWCGPCKAMAPVLNELAPELKGQVKIIKVDIDKNQPTAQKYQVRGVPTFILFHKGKILWQQSGALPKHEMKNILESHAAQVS